MKQIVCPICGTIMVKNLGHITPENGGEIFVAEDTKDSIECYCIISQFRCINKHTFFIPTDNIKDE